MSPSDQLLDLIARGEGPTVEFKSSLRYNTETHSVDKSLTKAVAKEICGLLNSHGGELLIGVADDGCVLGIEPDIETLSKKSLDGFELTLRNALSSLLGPETSPAVRVDFVLIKDKTVARLSCSRHPTAVFIADGDAAQFYVRDGNRTIPLNVRAAHDYITMNFPSDALTLDAVRDVVAEALHERLGTAAPSIETAEEIPPWLTVTTRRVVGTFMKTLSGSRGLKKLQIISPWISEFDHAALLTFDQLLSRLVDDGATAYVVTRPPEEEWHDRAIRRLGETGRANIALVPDLHTKLLAAHTEVGAFALLGSANLTQRSLANREIGVLINSYGGGTKVVRELSYEAAQIYRTRSRRLIYQAAF